MSQDYFSNKGKGPQGQYDEDDEETNNLSGPRQSASTSKPNSSKPAYMTIGTGSTSQHAARLQSLLDNDSGYGDSIASDDLGASARFGLGSPRGDPTLAEDRPIHSPSSRNPTTDPETARRNQVAAIHQPSLFKSLDKRSS